MMMGPEREGNGKWIRQCEKAEKLKQLSLVATFCTGCQHDKGEKSIAHIAAQAWPGPGLAPAERERQRWLIPRKLTHPLELVRFRMVHRYTYLWYPLPLIQEDLLSVVYHQR